MLRPGYRYTVVPGGLKRSKLVSPTAGHLMRKKDRATLANYHHLVPSKHDLRSAIVDTEMSYPAMNSYTTYPAVIDDPVSSFAKKHHYPQRVFRCCQADDGGINTYQPASTVQHPAHLNEGNYYRASKGPLDYTRNHFPPGREEQAEFEEDFQSRGDMRSPLHHFEHRETIESKMCAPPGQCNCRCCRDIYPTGHRAMQPNPNVNNSPRLSNDFREAYSANEFQMDFQAAATKLSHTANNALNFFDRFQRNFQEEVDHLIAYANQNTIKLAWRDKVWRNEKYISSPKDGWKGSAHNIDYDSTVKPNDQHDWNYNDNAAGGGVGDGNQAYNRNQAHDDDYNDSVTTFHEHCASLKHSLRLFLHCQILEPKLRYSIYHNPYHSPYMHHNSSDHDDHSDPEDQTNKAIYRSSHRLKDRIAQCQTDLIPLLDRIADDSRYMEAALVEMRHLTNVLRAYGQSWRRSSNADAHLGEYGRRRHG